NLFDRHVHNEARRYSNRTAEMLNQAIKECELVVDARLFKGFVPPAALAWDRKAGVPQVIWNLGGLLNELNLVGLHVHARAATRLTPIKIKHTPIQRILVTFSRRRHRDMNVTEMRLRLLIAYAAPTSRKSNA